MAGPYHSPGSRSNRAPYPRSLPLCGAVPILTFMHDGMTFTLNGETRTLPSPLSVAGLLAELGLETRNVAVERNL